MWRGVVHKPTVLPRSQLVWATVYNAAARWARFPFKIKQKARGRRFGIAKKHCTQSDMWNPKAGRREGSSSQWVAWKLSQEMKSGFDGLLLFYLLLSSLIIFSPHLLPLFFHLQNRSANVRWTMWRRRTALAKIISESALTWLKAECVTAVVW